MPIPPLPRSALRDLLGIIRILWWARWTSGADEAELRAIASVGDDIARLVRAAQFEACVTTWHQARLAMAQVTRLHDRVAAAHPPSPSPAPDSPETMLAAAVRRILSTPNIPPPPLHAYAAPTGERPPLDIPSPTSAEDPASAASPDDPAR